MPDWNGSYAEFRLNFEQQGKRAKDLVKAARGGDASALARFKAPPKLAEAQYLIARELRFDNWTALKRHTAEMARAQAAMSHSALDGDLRTLHIRCGHDLQEALKEAGFGGDYFVDIYPYLFGPVREGPGTLEQRARHVVDSYGADFDPPLEFEGQVRALQDQERDLVDSAAYERVVLWFEHDGTDQLSLIHLLGHYARHPRPPRLELINIGDFPGSRRFTGLGELPPEALRLLWPTRRPVGDAQLELGLQAWRALASPDPRALAAIMRGGTPALPYLGPALHRHLRELPSVGNGLSLTEALALRAMTEPPPDWEGVVTLGKIYWHLHWVTDPLPGQGDGHFLRRVLAMEGASKQIFTRGTRQGTNPPWTDIVAITDLGRKVLGGEIDFRTLDPPPRWVGGLEITSGQPDWRWDDQRRDAVRR